MSFLVAVQSAVFYFLACTPCHELHHQHTTRQQAKKERRRKERIVMEQPHLYRHPDPFHTNPYWNEEIRMGPSLPKKRRGSDAVSKSLSQRRLTAASRDGRPSLGTGSSVVISMSEMGSVASPRPSTSPANAHGLGSAPTVVPEEDREDRTSSTLSKTASISTSADWNLKRYQREDEELWGHDDSAWSGHKLMDAIKHAGSTAGRYMESKLGLEKQITDEDRYNFYFTPRNPPVNDYHPPVVSSRPAHKDALRWMLQPPPPAKVMEGKVPVTRSASSTSRRTISTRDGGSLGRLVGERAVEARIRRGEMPMEDEGRSTPSVRKSRSRVSTAARTRSRRTTRTSSSATDSEEEAEQLSSRRRRVSYRPPGLESDDEDEGAYTSKSPDPLSNVSMSTHAAQKPRLPTILSSGYDDRKSSGLDNNEPAASGSIKEIANASTSPIMDKDAQPPLPTPSTEAIPS